VDEANDLASSPNLGRCQHKRIFENQSRKTYAEISITIDEHLSSSLSRNPWGNLGELSGCARGLDSVGLLCDLVLVKTAGVLPPSQHKLGIMLRCLDNLLLDIDVDWRLDRAHESCAHVDALGAQGQRGSQTLSVCESARGDERNSEGLACARKEDEVRDVALANVSRALEAVDAEEVHAELDGALRVSDGRALVQDCGSDSLELLDNWARAVSCRLHNPDALIDDNLCVCAIVRWDHCWEESDVDTEWVLGEGLRLANLLTEVFRCWLCEGSEETETAGIGNSGGHFSVANPLHATLDNRNCERRLSAISSPQISDVKGLNRTYF